MDEMKIQSDLVFDKNSGDLVGFMDLGDPMTNFACLDGKDIIATHALAFLVRGLCTDVKHIIAYFFTGNVTSYQLMPIFWKVVSTLELSLDLWVVALVNDGASPNRKLFNLHVKLAIDRKCDVVYKTINLFAPSRFIYFFADGTKLSIQFRLRIMQSFDVERWPVSAIQTHSRYFLSGSSCCSACASKIDLGAHCSNIL